MRDVMFTGTLTAEERLTVIRFAIDIGEKATCRTNGLLRPFDPADLEKAFAEREAAIEKREKAYIDSARTFDPAKASAGLRAYLGGEVTNESYAKYIADLIRQEEEAKKLIRRSYHIYVDFAELDPEDAAFHASLSPRVTFGDTNELHEACSFSLTPEIKAALQDSSLGSDPEDYYDYGAFYLGRTPLIYEDLTVSAQGETILSTVSHEGIMDLFLSHEDLRAFASFELDKARNRKIAEKLLS